MTRSPTTPDNPEAIRREVEGQIVAWLRNDAEQHSRMGNYMLADLLRGRADAIARGEHRATPLPQADRDRIRAEAFEEAAKLAETQCTTSLWTGRELGWVTAPTDDAANIARAIRALSQPAEAKGEAP